MHAICDWRNRGKVEMEFTGVDSEGRLCNKGEGTTLPGWMPKLIQTCENQLNVAYTSNAGFIRMARSIDEWLHMVENAIGAALSAHDQSEWRERFAPFYEEPRSANLPLNEGGFFIRFTEWVQRRLQQRWYVDTYGRTVGSDEPCQSPKLEFADSYQRPVFLPYVGPPVPPSVLPFHTVSIRRLRYFSLQSLTNCCSLCIP